MIYPTVYLAAEDLPGLAVGRKLLAEAPPLTVYKEDNLRGNGKLKIKAGSLHGFAKLGHPVLLLTDLDMNTCAPSLVKNWVGKEPQDLTPCFLFRICVREVESWILAHQQELAGFFGVSSSIIPRCPERLLDPKSKLIQIAQKASRRIRCGMTPTGSATIGPDYNKILCEFINTRWSPQIAAESAPSLAKARDRISQLAASVRSDSGG